MNLLWLSLHQWKYLDFLNLIKNTDKKLLVFTPNPEIYVRASRDSEFEDILKKADYNVPDGNGLYVGYMMNEWMSFFHAACVTFFEKKKVNEKYGELIKGSDLTRDILESWKDRPIKILIIDRRVTLPKSEFEYRKEAVQKNLKSLIESKYPWITTHVVFVWEKDPEEIARIIIEENIGYVFSCIGMKSQEKLLVDIFDYLDDSQKVVWLGVGASIDFLLGLQKRAPKVFQKLGLEWLYRLMMQPQLRAKRIYDAVVEFPRIVWERIAYRDIIK
jgi:N-acetylglucosaminyldiphosphoundecaprenol N-acetyl-beta-D-mannosaminyltransferase